MANPRQRRKAKSSTHKAVSHSKRAKRLQKKMPTIRGPKALRDAWDPSKTVRQNYVALGFEHTLNPLSSGGSETHAVDPTASSSDGVPQGQKGLGRIIRDASGRVVGVELPSEGSEREQESVTTSVWARDGADGETANTIIQDLETLAACTSVRARHASLGERRYLARLVAKHGADVAKMARDRRLNPEQRTENELRRAMARAGLCGDAAIAVPGETPRTPGRVSPLGEIA